MKLARQPLLHFLVIGAGIGAFHAWSAERGPVRAADRDATIRVTATEIDRMDAEWRARWMRPPTDDEFEGMIRARVRETALYREALAMGLDEEDPVIRRLLVQKLDGIARDLVELGLSPTDQDLEAFFTENADRYRPPASITFTQVFLDPDRRGDETLGDAAALLAEARELDPPTSGVEELGDPFMLQCSFAKKPRHRVASLFGTGFADAVFELEPQRWHGPVLSGYGTHLVYVDELRELPPPALDEVRDRVAQDWMDERRREITESFVDGVVEKYEIVIERELDDEAP